jgi:hypothetical protein
VLSSRTTCNITPNGHIPSSKSGRLPASGRWPSPNLPVWTNMQALYGASQSADTQRHVFTGEATWHLLSLTSSCKLHNQWRCRTPCLACCANQLNPQQAHDQTGSCEIRPPGRLRKLHNTPACTFPRNLQQTAHGADMTRVCLVPATHHLVNKNHAARDAQHATATTAAQALLLHVDMKRSKRRRLLPMSRRGASDTPLGAGVSHSFYNGSMHMWQGAEWKQSPIMAGCTSPVIARCRAGRVRSGNSPSTLQCRTAIYLALRTHKHPQHTADAQSCTLCARQSRHTNIACSACTAAPTQQERAGKQLQPAQCCNQLQMQASSLEHGRGGVVGTAGVLGDMHNSYKDAHPYAGVKSTHHAWYAPTPNI